MTPRGRPGGSPRVDAARVLASALTGRERSTDLLNRYQAAYPPERARDAALLHELVLGVLRRRLALAAVLSGLVRRPLDDARPAVREVLMCLAYQALFLERVPGYARVSEAVEAARRLAGDGAASFVNAVGRGLERVLASGDPLSGLDPATRWSVPSAVLSRIAAVTGSAPGDDVLAPLAERSRAALRANAPAATVADVVAALAARGVRARPSALAPGGVVVEEGAAPALGDVVPALAIPQDEASQLVVAALDPRPGERVADLCAGTGVKTTQLLAAVGAPVLAVDLDGRKLGRAAETARAMGLPAPDPLASDVLSLPPDLDGTFDAVLLDAPCTGIGTLVRRPEVRYLRKEADFGRAAGLQGALLERAARLVRPGGRLVYAVCSFAPEEGPEVVAAALARGAGRSLDAIAAPAPLVRPDGTLLTLPWRDGVDGFYVARLRVG